MNDLEEAHQKVMASWRGHVDEETMRRDLADLELKVLDTATEYLSLHAEHGKRYEDVRVRIKTLAQPAIEMRIGWG